jgi:hypothetical protein
VLFGRLAAPELTTASKRDAPLLYREQRTSPSLSQTTSWHDLHKRHRTPIGVCTASARIRPMGCGALATGPSSTEQRGGCACGNRSQTFLRRCRPRNRLGPFQHSSGQGSFDIAAAIFALIPFIIAIAPDTDPIRWWCLGIGSSFWDWTLSSSCVFSGGGGLMSDALGHAATAARARSSEPGHRCESVPSISLALAWPNRLPPPHRLAMAYEQALVVPMVLQPCPTGAPPAEREHHRVPVQRSPSRCVKGRLMLTRGERGHVPGRC